VRRIATALAGVVALLAATVVVAQPEVGSNANAAAAALQVLPGHLVGAGYEPDKFYVRHGAGAWELTYAGDEFQEQVRGQLPNLRSANAVFDDESGTIRQYDPDFDAQANTNEFISRLDDYRKHGLIATDVNLQGGNPGFGGAVNPAFNSDGTLRQEWMDRAGQVIEAHAQRNMVVVLGYFYFHQDQYLDDDDAVRQAVTNATDWLIENDYRNVVIEIANEHNNDDAYDHDIISSDEGMAELIRLAQSRFDNAGFRLAVSASRWGDASWPDGAVADAADLALVHCNGVDPETCADRSAAHREDHAYPIVVNEDDNTSGDFTGETLDAENETIDRLTAAGVSYGLMLNQWNQYATCVYHSDCGSEGFTWALGPQPGANSSGVELLDNFAHGVLDHLESVVFQP
jgi:hypothetical protein